MLGLMEQICVLEWVIDPLWKRTGGQETYRSLKRTVGTDAHEKCTTGAESWQQDGVIVPTRHMSELAPLSHEDSGA